MAEAFSIFLVGVPSLATAIACFFLYFALASRLARGRLTVLLACAAYIVVALLVAQLMAVTTYFVLLYAYTNYPDIRPASWDVSIFFVAVFQLILCAATAAIGIGVACWRFARRGGRAPAA